MSNSVKYTIFHIVGALRCSGPKYNFIFIEKIRSILPISKTNSPDIRTRVSFHFFLHVTADWASFCIKFDKVIWLLCKRLYCVKLSHLYILFGRFLFFIMFFIFSWESHQQSKISREHRTFRKIDFMSFYKPLSGGTRKMKNLSK